MGLGSSLIMNSYIKIVCKLVMYVLSSILFGYHIVGKFGEFTRFENLADKGLANE